MHSDLLRQLKQWCARTIKRMYPVEEQLGAALEAELYIEWLESLTLTKR